MIWIREETLTAVDVRALPPIDRNTDLSVTQFYQSPAEYGARVYALQRADHAVDVVVWMILERSWTQVGGAVRLNPHVLTELTAAPRGAMCALQSVGPTAYDGVVLLMLG